MNPADFRVGKKLTEQISEVLGRSVTNARTSFWYDISAMPDLSVATTPRLTATRRGCLWRVALIVASVLVVVVAAGALSFSAVLGYVVREGARRLGVELEIDSARVERFTSWRSADISLQGIRASLQGVKGVMLRADTMKFSCASGDPTLRGAESEAASVVVEGAVTEVLPQVARWAEAHPTLLRIRASGSDLRVLWRTEPTSAPWLTLSRGRLSSSGKSSHFTAVARATAGVVPFNITADAKRDPPEIITVTLSRDGTSGAIAAMTLRPNEKPPTADITLHAMRLDTLGPSFVGLPVSSAVLSLSASLTLGDRSGVPTVDGHGEVRLAGYVPPHPKEIDSLVAGKDTSATFALHAPSSPPRLDLTQLVVHAGRLELKGNGTVLEEGDHATAKLTVSGPIPCRDLAGAVAHEDLGGLLGKLAGELARQAVDGNATVTVTVTADSRNLAAAKLTQNVGLGCHLSAPALGP